MLLIQWLELITVLPDLTLALGGLIEFLLDQWPHDWP
jgi:hypothetical protein